MARKIKFVANPAAGNFAVGKKWPNIEKKLRSVLGEMTVEFTQSPGDATHMTRHALRDGCETVVAVGGDGTIHEVVNGFFNNDQPINSAAALGVISIGTGGDWVRTLKAPTNIVRVAESIFINHTRKCDLGRLRCVHADGSDQIRYFINIADAGFGGELAQRVNDSSKALGSFFAYLGGLMKTLASYDNKRVQVRVDESFNEEVTLNSIVVANGQFFGGRMWIAPQAQIDDGLFEILIIGDVAKLEALANLYRIYNGTLSRHPKVTTLRGKKVVLESDSDVFIEADGEVPGKLPATFEIMPAALNIII